MKSTKISHVGPGNNWKAVYRKGKKKMQLSDISHRQAETFRKTMVGAASPVKEVTNE